MKQLIINVFFPVLIFFRYLTSTEGSDTLPQEKRLRIFFHVFMGLPVSADNQ